MLFGMQGGRRGAMPADPADGAGGGHGADAWVHPTAIVEAGAWLGPGTKVWHFCHVRAGARVGGVSVLGQNVYVGGAVRVGDGCRIQNNVSLYDGVELGASVFVGPSVVFTNVRRPRAFRSQRDALGSTRIGRGATLGANATVVCGDRASPRVIGAYSFVGAGAVVTRDVPAHALVVGAPARQVGWVCVCGGDLAELPEAQSVLSAASHMETGACWSCVACGARYRLKNGEIAQAVVTPQEAQEARGP